MPNSESQHNAPVQDVVSEVPDSLRAEPAQSEASQAPVPGSDDDELLVQSQPSSVPIGHEEIALDVLPEDITDDPLCLWPLLEQCFEVKGSKARLR